MLDNDTDVKFLIAQIKGTTTPICAKCRTNRQTDVLVKKLCVCEREGGSFIS